MKRTTIYLDPELEVWLKLEARRRKKPVSEVIRETLKEKQMANTASGLPVGVGAYSSGRSDIAERAEELLEEGFGLDPEQQERFRRRQ